MKTPKRGSGRASIDAKVRRAYRAAVDRFLTPRDPSSRAGVVSADPMHNVIGIGIGKRRKDGESVPAILLYVRNKLSEDYIDDDELLPREIRGIATDVIETGTPRLTSRPGDAVIVPLGGMDNLGTFGALVQSNNGKRYILSNNHVLANLNQNPPGTSIFASDWTEIAKLRAFIPLSLTAGNLTDAALAEIAPGVTVQSAVGGNHSWTSSQPGVPADEAAVFKTGAVSGFREGTIESPLATQRVDDEFGRSFTMRDAFIIADGNQPFCVAGDSGSVVVDAQSRKAIGLVVGRAINSAGVVHTVACPLNTTLSLLKTRLGASSLILLT